VEHWGQSGIHHGDEHGPHDDDDDHDHDHDHEE
jgi:hypothetical protein